MYTSEEIKERKRITPSVKKYLSVIDGTAIVAGMVIGPGIFKTPSLVASSIPNEIITLSLWALGGLISFLGALCYAELTSTYPHAGGEYHYLYKSFGRKTAFLFAWARMTVIQTGSIAMLSFVIGDYASEALHLGKYSSSLYAVLTVFILTWVNLKGIKFSSRLQKVLMGGLLFGILFVVLTGLLSGSPDKANDISKSSQPWNGAGIGQAMIFILLTYGGWNEASYISSDVSRSRKDIVRVLFYSIALITFVYLIMNVALIKGLGFQNAASSDIVAAELVLKTLGRDWVRIISIVISFAALSTVNAVMITGARTNYALGRDFSRFSFLAKQREETYTGRIPVNSFLLQSGIALLLIILGSVTRRGFSTMVEYTAPVFWFFFLMVGSSLFILRLRDPSAIRPFKVPLYPVVPLLFCISAAYMLHASLAYTGVGAVIGVIVLLAGIPFVQVKSIREKI